MKKAAFCGRHTSALPLTAVLFRSIPYMRAILYESTMVVKYPFRIYTLHKKTQNFTAHNKDFTEVGPR